MKTERIYYPVESVLCTCLYNIILNVEAVQKLEKCLNIFWVHVFFYLFIFLFYFIFFLYVGTCLAFFFSVSFGSHFNVILHPTVVSLFQPKTKEDKPGDRVEECRKQCHLEFQIGDLRKGGGGKD